MQVLEVTAYSRHVLSLKKFVLTSVVTVENLFSETAAGSCLVMVYMVLCYLTSLMHIIVVTLLNTFGL